MAVDRGEWLTRLAAVLGTDPLSEDDADALLALASVAAHGAERSAAPLSTYLVGLAGVDPRSARQAAERLAEELEGKASDGSSD